MKNRAARGRSEGDNDKAPSTSKFHFSKGKYGNIVLAWHGVLVQKAEANFPDICVQAHKIFGVMDVEKGNENRRAQNVNPKVRTHVGLESEEANDSDEDDEEHVNGNNEDDQNSHGNDGDDDAVDDGNGQNDENDAGEEIEELEVDPSPSHHGGRCHHITKA